jgi:hypothetical protein
MKNKVGQVFPLYSYFVQQSNRALNNIEVKTYTSGNEDYTDVNLRIKLKKLGYVNELLQTLTFKNEVNEFADVTVESKEFVKLQTKAKKCKIVTDKNVQLLFGFKKKAVDSSKRVLGFINIASKRTRCKEKRSQSYAIVQEDFKLESDTEEEMEE